MVDVVGALTGLIDSIKDLINEVKEFGLAVKEVFDPALATNPLTFPAGAYQRAQYLGTKANALIDALTAIFSVVENILP